MSELLTNWFDFKPILHSARVLSLISPNKRGSILLKQRIV
jgi:hypothetical protein